MNLRALLPGLRSTDLAAAASTLEMATPATLELASPWAPTHNLARVLDGQVFADVIGPLAVRPVTRQEAMAVPAVARARHIICGTVARIPMRGRDRAGAPYTPAWQAAATTAQMPAFHRDLWTADDLLFHGWSCWSVVRDASGRVPLRMDRIPMGRWSVDDVGRVFVADAAGDHKLVDQRTVCLIPGPHEGILTAAAGTIRHAADLQRAASMAAKHPAAYLVLRQKAGLPLKYDDPSDPDAVTVQSTLRDWRIGREMGGGVGFLPEFLELDELGTFDQHLVTEGRNAAAVDVARVCSLPADLLDAAGPSSLTYATTRDNDQRAIQYGVGLYLSAISARLSQDDVSPHGSSIRYALEDWLEDPTATDPATPAGPDVSRETPPALSVVPSQESVA